MSNSPSPKTGLVHFHTRHSLLLLGLLLSLFLAFCFLLVQNYQLSESTAQRELENRFRQRVTAIDSLLGNIRSQIRALQLSAEADMADRTLQPVQPVPLPFRDLRDHPDGTLFHLDHFRPPLTETMLGNLSGSGSIEGRDPDLYPEVHMALNLNHRFRAIFETFRDLSWIYYVSKNDFINIYPWVPSSESHFTYQIKEHEAYSLSLPGQNTDRQPFWTRPYLDAYGTGLIATCSAPVYSGDRFLGAVAVDLSIDLLCSLVRDFGTDEAPLLLINGDRQLLAHPTLVSASNPTIHTLQDALPTDLQEPTEGWGSLPAGKLIDIGSWAVLRAPLQSAPWEVLYIQQRPPLTKAFITPLGGGALSTLLVLLGLIGAMAYLNHRHIVWPSERLLHFIAALGRHKSPLIDARIPAMWRPWFENIETTFRDNELLTEEIRQHSEMLERRVTERTIELDRINQALREEIEERSKAEDALRVVNQKLQELSLVDGLTGIANYRKFDEYLSYCWKQMLRDQAPISIIMCDVDYFKQFNDTYGHQAGDDCLRQIAGAIRDALQRPADLVARYGGEEFIVVLPATDHAGAKRVATSIQQAIAALQIPHTGSLAASRVTFSIGMATCVPDHGGSADALLEAADQSLYRAKDTGRNRIIALPLRR